MGAFHNLAKLQYNVFRFLSFATHSWSSFNRDIRIPVGGPLSGGYSSLGLAFIVLTYRRFMGFYYTPFWMALLGMRDLVHGPRPKLNYPAPTVHR